MPIKQLTPMSEIENYAEEQLNRLNAVLLRNLAYIGEMCLNRARQTDSYKDRTGNLRSSIGYVISVDGRIVKASDFKVVKEGRDGAKDGLSFARRIARSYPQGLCLIVVAGMKYAAYVSAKGFDVLDSSELLAESLTNRILKQLGFS